VELVVLYVVADGFVGRASGDYMTGKGIYSMSLKGIVCVLL
jgi:hypothetical protein